jgi:hypothetical protein
MVDQIRQAVSSMNYAELIEVIRKTADIQKKGVHQAAHAAQEAFSSAERVTAENDSAKQRIADGIEALNKSRGRFAQDKARFDGELRAQDDLINKQRSVVDSHNQGLDS